MYEVSLEILRVNLEEFEKRRDQDMEKYRKEKDIYAMFGCATAWEERIQDIKNAMSTLGQIGGAYERGREGIEGSKDDS